MDASVLSTIDSLLEVVPETEVEFREDLQIMKDGIFIELPEDRHLWTELMWIVGIHLPKLDELEEYSEWQRRVIAIWRDAHRLPPPR